MISNSKKIIRVFYGGLAAGLVFLAGFLFFSLPSGRLELHFLNVGQGDALLIQTPEGYNILVDGGPDNAVLYELGKYLPFYNRQIDLMVLTHPHADHLAGLVEILKRHQVNKILTTGVFYGSAEYEKWLALIKEKNIPVEIANHQGIMPLGGQVHFFILFPEISLENKKIKNVNNASIVGKLIYGKSSALLSGDFEDEEELVGKVDLTAQILKAGHHGSDNANSRKFLAAVGPKYAVISVGENKYGHPNQKTVENFEALGAKILRTDQPGDINFVSDGQKFSLSPVNPYWAWLFSAP